MRCRPLNQKRMLKTVMLSLIALFIPAVCISAPQFGLGVSINGDSEVLHCPVKLNEQFKLEGLLGIYSYDQENSSAADVETIMLGIGGYGFMDIYDKTQIYYGGKLRYHKVDRPGSDVDGLGIAPTFGFEYFFTKNLSLGGEAELYYMFYNGDSDDYKEYGTDSRVIFRFYF